MISQKQRVRGIIPVLFVFLLILTGGCAESDNKGGTVVDEPIVDSNADKLIWAMNQNCKYVLTSWWNEPKDVAFQPSYLPNSKPLTDEQQSEVEKSLESFKNWSNQDYLLLPNWKKNDLSEQAILPSCYASRILSSAIHYGYYDETVTGISIEEAIKKTTLLISSLVKYHCSNTEEGWGHCWQGALWAEMVGMSAVLLKEYLSPQVWNMVSIMIKSECDYVINVAGIQYYRDKSGQIWYGRDGDSQSETEAWNATILALAIAQFPVDSNIETWTKSFIEFNIAATACPTDVYSDRIIDGHCLAEFDGSNINEDGTVTNHGKLHIDYMASPIESFAESSIALSFSSSINYFECLIFNVDKIYNALVDLDLGQFESSKAGHHFYERTNQGQPSCDTNMPEENEWGQNIRQANYYLVDSYVSLIGADASLPEKLRASKWGETRLARIIEMIKRDNSGRIYQEGEENFASGQLYAMACLSQVYSMFKGDYLQK